MPAFLPFVAGGLSLYSAYKGNQEDKRARKAQAEATQFERERWNAGAPFRNEATRLMGQEVDGDAVARVFADPGNPYAAGNTFQPLTRARTPEPTRTAQPTREAIDTQFQAEFAKDPQGFMRRLRSGELNGLAAAMGGQAASPPAPSAETAQGRAKLSAFAETIARPMRLARGMP